MKRKDPNSIINPNAPLITNPVGLDAVVQSIQIELMQRLGWLDICFGAAETAGKKVNGRDVVYPQVWQGKDKDLLNVLANDTLNSYAFFVVQDPESIEDYEQNISNFYSAETDLIFWFDLESLNVADLYEHNYRENLATEIQSVLSNITLPYNASLEINQIYRKPQEIFTGFDIEWIDNHRLQYPNVGLRINLNLTYLNDDCGLGAAVPDIVCADSIAIVQDQDGNTLATENIASGASKIIPVNAVSAPLYIYPYDELNTGQDVSYAIGDDKWVRDNIFTPEINSWPTDRPLVKPILDPNDPTKLLRGATPSGFNWFGNLERFTDTLGGQDYANNLVIDHLTGLMIDRIFKNGTSWLQIISNALVDNFHLGNYKEYESLVIVNQLNGSLNYFPFNNNSTFRNFSDGNNYFTSTSVRQDPSNAVQFNNWVTSSSLGAETMDFGFVGKKKGINNRYYIFKKAFTYDPLTDDTKLILT
jgi:hypothetical protein